MHADLDVVVRRACWRDLEHGPVVFLSVFGQFDSALDQSQVQVTTVIVADTEHHVFGAGSESERHRGGRLGSKQFGLGHVDEAEALSVEIVPHIDLIRTRTSLLSDCYTNKRVNSTRSDQFLRTHQSMWKEVWTRKTNRGVKEVYMTVEDDGYESTAEFEENSYTSRMERLRDSIRAIRRCYDSWLRAYESEASSDSKLKR